MLPVLLIGFNRPELLEKRVAELLLNNVEILNVSIDGNQSIRPEMELSLSKIRKMCQGKCILRTKLHSKNQGLAKHITSEITKMLEVHAETLKNC
jgi:hypothetical protein